MKRLRTLLLGGTMLFAISGVSRAELTPETMVNTNISGAYVIVNQVRYPITAVFPPGGGSGGGGLTVNLGTIASVATNNMTWAGTLPAASQLHGPLDLEFIDKATDAAGAGSGAIVSGFVSNVLFQGNQTQAVAAHAAVTGDEYIEGPSSPFTPFKQYIGGFFNTATLAGDGSIVTTASAQCTASTCTAGSVIPVTAVTTTNGIYTHRFNVGDLFGISPVTIGLGLRKYWFGTITAVDPIAKTITINPPLIGTMAAGAAVWDLSQAANLWGVATDTFNNVTSSDTFPNSPNENLWSLTGMELDVGSRQGKQVWSRYGVIAVGHGNVTGLANDDAFTVAAAATGGGWQYGLMFSSTAGAIPMQSTGTLIAAEGGWGVSSFIDFSNISCTNDEIAMPGLIVDCTGLPSFFGDQSATTTTPILGALGGVALGYNHGGIGESDIFNAPAAHGAGGISFYEVAAGAGTIAGAPFFTISGTGNVVANQNVTANGGLLIASGAAGTTRVLGMDTGLLPRWTWLTDSAAESGANAGSNGSFCRYNDAGTLIDCPIAITRATGATSFSGIVTYASGLVTHTRTIIVAGDVLATVADIHVCMAKTVGAATVVNLPASPATGQTITVDDCKGDANANNITVTPAAGNIDGAGTFVINTNYGSWTGYYTGTIWKTTASR